MRTVSLEKQITGIINNGKVASTEVVTIHGKKAEVKTIQKGNFKCTVPIEYMADLMANARRLSRKKPERYPVPQTQKILAFLSGHREVIPYYVKMIKERKSLSWFQIQMIDNFPEKAQSIIKESVTGTKSDLQHVLMTMPPAWRKHESKSDKCLS